MHFNTPWAPPATPKRATPSRPSLLSRLIASATEVAFQLGHDIEPWQQDTRATALTWCVACKFAAYVNSKPQGGDDTTGGTALHSPCRGVMTLPYWPEVSLA